MRKLCIILLALSLAAGICAAAAEESAAKERLPDKVLMTYYDHSIFVGDSLIRMLRNYVKGVQKKDPGFFKYARKAWMNEHPDEEFDPDVVGWTEIEAAGHRVKKKNLILILIILRLILIMKENIVKKK